MPDTKVRVHTLADEIGVPSKIILAKCHAEGVELKNHMAVLSAGLEATIREWFSEGAHITSDEHSDRLPSKALSLPCSSLLWRAESCTRPTSLNTKASMGFGSPTSDQFLLIFTLS